MLNRDAIYEMLTKEDAYAQGWGKGKHSSNPDYPGHTVSRESGQPFTLVEWMNFAQLYLDGARRAHACYTPDIRSLRIRMLKAASLLVTALQVHGQADDLEGIAGVSSNKFPIFEGGLLTFESLMSVRSAEGLPGVAESVNRKIEEDRQAK